MAGTDSSSELASAVGRLSLKTGGASSTKAKPPKKKTAPVADSWEDEDLSSSGSDTETELENSSRDPGAAPQDDLDAGTQAPPPTPISPTYNNAAGRPFSPTAATYASSSSRPGSSQLDGPPREAKRPEKTDAVARRMIAAGLGLKVPKQTEEQKAYDKALREKERKRREEEREQEKRRQAEAEKAKQSIWED
jgi:hypothetical protein